MSQQSIAWGRVAALMLIPVVILAGIGVFWSYEQVNEGFVGVETQWGEATGTEYNAGPNWITPIRDSVHHLDVRPRTYTMAADVGEGDKKRHDAVEFKTLGGIKGQADVTVRFRLSDEPGAPTEFYSRWYTLERAEQKLIRPTVRATMYDEASGIEPDTVMSERGRDMLRKAVYEELQKEFADEALVLEAVQVRNVVLLDQQYMQSLRDKKRAQKAVEVEEINIQKEKKIADQKRVQAEADADVIRIKGEALRDNPEVLQLRLIDAYSRGTVFVTDGDTPMIMDTSSSRDSDNSTSTTAYPGSP